MSKPITSLTLVLTLCCAGNLLLAPAAPAATSGSKEETDKLIAVLKSDADLKAKHDACRQLAVVGTKDAIPTLAALLGDDQLAHMARYALEPIPDPAVDEALRDALGSVQGLHLVGVIGSLGVRKDTRAVRPLGTFLDDPNPEVAQAAARALGKIGNTGATRFLLAALPKTEGQLQLHVCEGLFRCAETSAAEGQAKQAFAIYDRIRQLPATTPRQVRAGALRGVLLTGGSSSPALLKESLGQDDYILFSAAVQTAQEMTGPNVTEILAAGLEGLSIDRQVLLLQTLGARGDTQALPAIVKASQNGPQPVRVAALNIIGQLGNASTVPPLFEAALQPDQEIARAAKTTLAGLASTPDLDQAILGAITQGDMPKRLVAIDVVAQRRSAAANAALLRAAADPEKRIRLAAVDALGQTADDPNLPALVSLLAKAQDEEEIRSAENAVQSVCGRSDNKASCASQLLAAMPNAGVDAKAALLRLLRVVGGNEALQSVRAAVKDSNPKIQEAAVRTMCDWPTADAAPDLLVMAKTGEEKNRIPALRGYIRLIRDDSLSAEQKLAMAKEAAGLVQRDEEKKLLLGVLGTVPAPQALDMVMSYLESDATKEEACQAAVAICEKIVEQHKAAVAQALPKVREATSNNGLKRRARDILNLAQ